MLKPRLKNKVSCIPLLRHLYPTSGRISDENRARFPETEESTKMAEIESPKTLIALGPWVSAIRLNGADKPTLLSKIVKELARLADDGFEFDYSYEETTTGTDNRATLITVESYDCCIKLAIPDELKIGIAVKVTRKPGNETI